MYGIVILVKDNYCTLIFQITILDNSNINTVMLCPGTFSESKPCEIVVVLILDGLKCSMDQGKHLRRDVQVRKVV